MHNKIKIISSICLFSISSYLYANTVSLEKLIDIAVENNSNIKISKYTQAKQKATYNLSKTNYLPKVSLTGELARYSIESNASRIDDNVSGYTLSASQLLYDFKKTPNEINSAKKNLEASNFQVVQNIATTILNTKQAYYNILNNYQQINLAKESIKLDELHLDQANSYFKAGVRTLIDVTDARLQLSNSKLKLLQAEYSLKNSKTKLISILGSKNSNEIKIKQDAEIKTTIKSFKKNRLQLDKLLKRGLENRAEIKVYEKQIQALQLQLQNSNKEYYPTLNLDASYSDKNSDKIASIDTRQTTAGVYLKWDIFTGNSSKENIKISLITLNSLKQKLFQEKLQINEDITSSYLKVKENEESIDIGLINIELSADKLNLANQRYKAGLNDLVEVNNSKLGFTQAKSQLIDTYYGYLNSKAILEFNLGILLY